LIVSCAPTSRPSRGSFLSMLDDALHGAVAEARGRASVPLGNGAVEIEVVKEELTAPGRELRESTRAKTQTDWQPFVGAWARRTAAYERAQRSVAFLTPTLLKRHEEAYSEARQHGDGSQRLSPALAVGDLAHRFLQNWDFHGAIDDFPAQLDEYIGRVPARELAASRRQIELELQDIFRCFFSSEAYAEIAKSQILGREAPLLMPWNGQIMEGIIDVIYERRGRLYLADYKTDRIDRADIAEAAHRYRHQAEIYTRAAMQALQREVAAFKVIFLRLGMAVEIPIAGMQGQLFT
jgi:hypothetical protein